MKFHHLRDFLAVAQKGSLRAASRDLGIAQPAVTRSIQELEKEVGTPLFERHARGVVLTVIGAAFLRRAKAISNELFRARDEINQMRGVAQGSVRVALSMVAHMAMLPAVLPAFRDRYPEVHLDIIDAVFATVATELMDGSIDCYIGPPPEFLPSGMISEKLFDNTRVVLCRRGHPLAKAKHLRDLIDAEWITTSITANRDHELGPLFSSHALPAPKLVLQAHSALTLIVSVLASDMLTMLPRQWEDFLPTKDAFQTIRVAEPLIAPPICIIQRGRMPLTPAAEYFCDLIRRASVHIKPARSAKAAK